jgi:hypothetical protein
MMEGIMTPTGFGIRNDTGGAGSFGARRTKKDEKGNTVEYSHEGVDYICIPGQTIRMPFTGKIVREARPYSTGIYSGILIESKKLTVKMFYLEPYPEVIGKVVNINEPIGKAQNIGLKYDGVTPHIHVQIESCDPELIFGKGR